MSRSLFLLSTFLFYATAVHAVTITGPAHITDGDTIKIGEERVRLLEHRFSI